MAKQDKDPAAEISSTRKPRKPWLLGILLAVLVAIVAAVGYLGYLFAASPEVVRQPLLEHYHFRLQVIAEGKPVNFASAKFQEGYSKDNCNALLPARPIHFHDKKDQMVHIHWEGVTGGMVLKYYGWNYIGGPSGVLGYRFDDLPGLTKVPIHGEVLPALSENAKFYVYTGNETGYKKRSFDDFKSQDLEKFLGTTSNFPAHDINMKKRSGFIDKLFPKAYAHGGHDHGSDESETEDERLTRINNLLGNVVIFAQDKEPTDAQIKARFNDLEPLTDSTCGG